MGDWQGGLACCGSWGCKESDTTERLNWTELIKKLVNTLFLFLLNLHYQNVSNSSQRMAVVPAISATLGNLLEMQTITSTQDLLRAGPSRSVFSEAYRWFWCTLTFSFMCAESLHSRSLPGSSVHGILQARILEWVVMPSSRGSSPPKIKPVSLMSPVLADGLFCLFVFFSFLSFFLPMGYSPPGSSVHGILQARILKWVSMPFSRLPPI